MTDQGQIESPPPVGADSGTRIDYWKRRTERAEEDRASCARLRVGGRTKDLGARMTVRLIPALPDRPNEWAEVDSHYGQFLQRWAPGAFGNRETLEGVDRYRVIREEVVECPDPSPENPRGLPERTIIEAEARA